MLADSSIPRECFLDLMGPPNCLLSMPGNPGTSRNTSAVHAVQGDHHLRPWSGVWIPGAVDFQRFSGQRSSCIVCIPSFARADGSVSYVCRTEPLARTFGELPPPENLSSIKAFRDTEVIPSFEGLSNHHSISVPTIATEWEYALGNISPVSSEYPFNISPNGSSVKTSSTRRPCNLLGEQHHIELNNLPLQSTETWLPGLATSLYDDLGGTTSLQAILHPSEVWRTNDSTHLTDLDIDLLETSDNAISQSARDINWCEIDALSVPDPDDIMSREPPQNKNVQFASLLPCSAVRNPDCSATGAQSRPKPNTRGAITSNFNSPPNENIRTHDGLEPEPNNLYSFELTARSPVASLVVASNRPRFRRFQCSHPDCTSRSFSRRADLDRHIRKHSATERTFVCTEPKCGKRFYRKDKLLDHSRRIHYPKKAACTCAAGRT